MFMEGQIQLLEVKRRKHQATLAVDRHSTDARPIPNKACYSGRTRLTEVRAVSTVKRNWTYEREVHPKAGIRLGSWRRTRRILLEVPCMMRVTALFGDLSLGRITGSKARNSSCICKGYLGTRIWDEWQSTCTGKVYMRNARLVECKMRSWLVDRRGFERSKMH